MEPVRCPSCAQEIGMNRKCRTCLETLVDRGVEDMTPERFREVQEATRTWLESETPGIPSLLQQRVPFFLEILDAGTGGEAADVSMDARRAVAYALYYVVSPLDKAPDHVPDLGFTDDAVVLDIVVQRFRRELEAFCGRRGRDPASGGL